MSRQIEKVQSYQNGLLPDSVGPIPISERELSLIKLGAWSAKAVYGPGRVGEVDAPEEFSDYQPTAYRQDIGASLLDGTVKATCVQLFSSHAEKVAPKLLVIAIRGSTSKRKDWTVNFDDMGTGTDGDGFINSETRSFQVHGGFLACAKAMADKVSGAVSSVLSDAEKEEPATEIQLLFTGHSAGGAVASLLYAHMMSKNSSPLTDLSSKFRSIDCVVFGSPPVSKPGLDTYGTEHSTFLSIINEGDPVPRIDKDYIETLLLLYISPMPAFPVHRDLPPMRLDTAGTILFLKDGQPGFCAVAEDDSQKGIKNVLATTIFGNPRAHKMDIYLVKLGLVSIII
ncbi:hypothetical protein P175DRAFT_041651 [Aspergillus ochraceoroseus IBT 24754]|uniref:Fungal lipase-type domain-containing protein n=1 Tax=Aspergillus ochraceoroseus IBT 24754 TaxID=1392256 RepID=A0A2T5M7S8_9EURO|nr:uncharacterized protein P175DRAFT_041651 [Aspergillus ochraceoroseus IBT 24754]PTU24585.1 hypothetical protein P175DRAFT_041651 [Aspergillus ochraceoroseus IBT 24754]